MAGFMNRYTQEAYQGSTYSREEEGEFEGSEQLAAADQAAAVVSNDANLDEVYRLQDNADALSNTADFVDSQVNEGGEATAGEVGLAEQVADLATAGTGDTAEQVMPAAESYVGSKIATEGFRETVRNIVAAIKRMLKNVFERLKRFWKKMFGRCKPIISDAQKLLDRAKAAGGKHAREKTVELGGGLASKLVIDKKPVKSLKSVLTHFESNAKLLTKDIYSDALKANLDVGEAVVDALGDIDGTTASVEKGLGKLINAVERDYGKFVSAFTSSTSNDKRFDTEGYVVHHSQEILGGKRIFVQKPTLSGVTNDVQRARLMVAARAFFADAHKDQPDVESVDMEVAPLSVVEDLAAAIRDTAQEVHRFDTGKGFRDQEKIRARVEAAAEKLGNRKVDDEDRADGLSTKLRTAANFATLYVSISTTPFTPLADHMCSVMRALIGVGNRIVGEYSNAKD